MGDEWRTTTISIDSHSINFRSSHSQKFNWILFAQCQSVTLYVSFYTRNLHTIRFHSLSVWLSLVSSLFAWKSHLETDLQHEMELGNSRNIYYCRDCNITPFQKRFKEKSSLFVHHRMCVQNYEMVLLFRCVVCISSHLFVMWSIVFHLCVRVPEHMCTANEISIYHITMSSSWLWYGAFITKQRRETK